VWLANADALDARDRLDDLAAQIEALAQQRDLRCRSRLVVVLVRFVVFAFLVIATMQRAVVGMAVLVVMAVARQAVAIVAIRVGEADVAAVRNP
jgi:hypothetical protein